jgi:hypothetical protein
VLPICRQFASLKDNISNGHSALALVNVLLGFAIVTILVTTAWFGNTGARRKFLKRAFRFDYVSDYVGAIQLELHLRISKMTDMPANCPELIQFGLLELQDNRADDLWWQLKSPAIDSRSDEIRHTVSQK